jgi:hypothetical protein
MGVVSIKTAALKGADFFCACTLIKNKLKITVCRISSHIQYAINTDALYLTHDGPTTQAIVKYQKHSPVTYWRAPAVLPERVHVIDFVA